MTEGRLPFFFLGLRPPFLVLVRGADAAASDEDNGSCAAFFGVALAAVANVLLVVATTTAAVGRMVEEANVLLLPLLLGMMVEEASRLAPNKSVLSPARQRRNQDCSIPVVSGFVGKGVDVKGLTRERIRSMDGRNKGKDPS